MNLRMITKSYTADPVIGFLKIDNLAVRTRESMPTVLELISISKKRLTLEGPRKNTL